MKRMIAWSVLAGMATMSAVAAQKPAAPPPVSGIDRLDWMSPATKA